MTSCGPNLAMIGDYLTVILVGDVICFFRMAANIIQKRGRERRCVRNDVQNSGDWIPYFQQK
jgi:hypothetical protein